ncbi:MAG: putative peptide zinc metalloprotease protein [Thermoleophilaceae bacterium]|nr:putative peptide zinc metalloprotease protein [Thermoleophilaceae bacterium]
MRPPCNYEPSPAMALDSFELLLPDGVRVPLNRTVTIGRAPTNVVCLKDPAVSRRHARIDLDGGRPRVEDAGSSSGTWVDGARIERPRVIGDGARVRVGDSYLILERRRAATEAGRTIVVPEGASAALPIAGDGSDSAASTRFGTRPRLRSGYALKRLDASEGVRRWILKDLRGGAFVRLSDADAALVQRIDGQRSLADLVREAEELGGADGPLRLAGLLAELSDRGLLAGVAADEAPPTRGRGWRRLFVPRQRTWAGAGDFFDRLYRSGGRVLLTQPALRALAAVAVSGALAFAYLVAGRYGTPFVVGKRVGLGGLAFVLGRLALAAVHEAAHALTMSSFGRRVGTAGIKVVLIFPYAFVDTSDAWFEPRRRRIAVSAAGPVSDFSLGGLFALLALCLPAGTLRDVFFQLALAGYIGGVFNLNPFLPRDGYQIVADLLRQPQLKARANAYFKRRLSGGGRGSESALFLRYSEIRVAWLAVAAMFAIAMSLHYRARFAALLPGGLVWGIMVVLWLAFFAPVAIELGRPVVARLRARRP